MKLVIREEQRGTVVAGKWKTKGEERGSSKSVGPRVLARKKFRTLDASLCGGTLGTGRQCRHGATDLRCVAR